VRFELERGAKLPYAAFHEHRLRYLVHRIIDFLGGSMYEPDGKTPSSARLIAVSIFTTLNVLTIGIVGGLVRMIVVTTRQIPHLAEIGKSTADLVKTVELLTKATVTISLWWFLFLAATALSLYGINVWKYVAAIRAGTNAGPDDPPAVPAAPAVPTVSQAVAAVKGAVTQAPQAPAAGDNLGSKTD
jgi:hypothetical protein